MVCDRGFVNHWIFLRGARFVVAMSATLVVAVAAAGNWTQLQGNAAKTGVNASERLGQLTPAFTLDVLGAGTDTQINLAGPVVVWDTACNGLNGDWWWGA